MKNTIAMLIALTLLCSPLAALAGEVKLIGIVEHIGLQGGKTAKQANLVVKDKGGKAHKVVISDPQNLDKVKDHRITEGDTVRMKYDDGTGTVTYLRKTAGC